MKHISKDITEVTIASTLEKFSGSHIDNDILLFDDLAKIPFPYKTRRMQCIMAGLCLRGSAQYLLDTVTHNVGPNDVIIISAGMVVDNCMFSRDFCGIGFILSTDFFSETVKDVHEISSLFLFARSHPVSQLTDAEAATFREYFQILKSKMDCTTHHFRRDVARLTIATMIYDLGNTIYRIMNSGERKKSRGDTIFTDFIALVEKNFRTERRVSWYGQQLGITPKYLSETIKQISQRTPNEWIDNYVVMELRVQLKNSRKSIKQIAQEMNFPNQSFLGKYFKEHVGMSPTEYRRS